MRSPPAMLLLWVVGQAADCNGYRPGRRRALGLASPRAGRDHAILARPLRVVERAVGGRGDRVSGRRLRESGHAEADRDVDASPVRREDGALLERDPGALCETG